MFQGHRVGCLLLVLALACPALRAQGLKFDARSAHGGKWSDAGTWENGRAPRAGDRVQIRPDHAVIYDVDSSDALRMVHVAGTLTFARDRNTRLDVGLLKIQSGDDAAEDGADCDAHSDHGAPGTLAASQPVLEIGTTDHPIPAGITATIRLVYFPGANKETEPAIVDCGGRWDLHGAPMSRTWVKLGAEARAGDQVVRLEMPVTGWKTGDSVLITTSELMGYENRPRRMGENADFYGTERRTISGIDGASIRLDRPLKKAHLAGEDGRAEVANLSRNVVIESADPAGIRGHTMYHHGSSGSISYAEFRHLGKKGLLGRYPIHFHLVRDTMRGSSVIGTSIWDSDNRWIAIHGTDYLLVRDCVGYECLGHGYFLEDATEEYNILDRNLAVGAFKTRPLPHQALEFDDNEAAGFWWANGRNVFTRNVACENYQYGFRYQIDRSGTDGAVRSVLMPDGSHQATDVRTIPFLRFEDNESHGNGLYDFDFGDDPDGAIHGDRRHPFIVRRLHAWMTNYAMRPNVSFFLGEDLYFNNANYGVYHPTYNQQVFRNVRVKQINGEPINRGHDDESFQNGSFTYDGLTIENCRCGRDPLIQLSCTSDKPGQSGHFRNVKTINSISTESNVVDLGGGPRNDKLENGVVYYFHDWPVAGQMLKVVSTKFPALMNDGDYRSIPQVTGKDVRATELPNSEFPQLLDPASDLPPATLITSILRNGSSVTVHGVTADTGDISSVDVNGTAARITSAHAVADWEAILSAEGLHDITARATDRAGNKEQTPAQRTLLPAAGDSK